MQFAFDDVAVADEAVQVRKSSCRRRPGFYAAALERRVPNARRRRELRRRSPSGRPEAGPYTRAVLTATGPALEQERITLAAILLFAFVIVVLLTGVALLLLSLQRRRQRGGRRDAAVDQIDAWREAGRRTRPADPSGSAPEAGG